jgi:hypothetical protein
VQYRLFDREASEVREARVAGWVRPRAASGRN